MPPVNAGDRSTIEQPTPRELEELFEISHERIVEIDRLATQGVLPGEPSGPVQVNPNHARPVDTETDQR